MKKNGLKIIIGLLLVFAVTGTAILVLMNIEENSPAKNIALARENISDARLAGADIYAPIIFAEATSLYDSAHNAWQKENKRFIFFRHYAKASAFAKQAVAKAEASKQKSLAYTKDLKSNLVKELHFYNEKCATFERQFSELPLDKEVRNSFLTAQISLKEAETDYKNQDYPSCVEKIKAARQEIDFIFSTTKSLLEDYFTMFGQWADLKAQALDYSAQHNDYALVVSKFQKKCFVYYAGSQFAAYDIELGKNWIGDKKRKGDKTTPEGKYQITEKKSGKQTKYYKALLINFPNQEDKLRFAEAKKKGTLPRTADIGGLIELHGDGGRGTNWTDGCIALKNEDMDQLYAKVKKGTPIFIVGSTIALDKLMSW